MYTYIDIHISTRTHTYLYINTILWLLHNVRLHQLRTTAGDPLWHHEGLLTRTSWVTVECWRDEQRVRSQSSPHPVGALKSSRRQLPRLPWRWLARWWRRLPADSRSAPAGRGPGESPPHVASLLPGPRPRLRPPAETSAGWIARPPPTAGPPPSPPPSLRERRRTVSFVARGKNHGN